MQYQFWTIEIYSVLCFLREFIFNIYGALRAFINKNRFGDHIPLNRVNVSDCNRNGSMATRYMVRWLTRSDDHFYCSFATQFRFIDLTGFSNVFYNLIAEQQMKTISKLSEAILNLSIKIPERFSGFNCNVLTEFV